MLKTYLQISFKFTEKDTSKKTYSKIGRKQLNVFHLIKIDTKDI